MQMNFFKKFYRRKTLSILDDTQPKQNLVKVRPGSGGLRRSGGLSSADNYDSNETKLFEEPLANFSNDLNRSSNWSAIDKGNEGLSGNGTTSHIDQIVHFQQPSNNLRPASASTEKTSTSQHTSSHLPSSLPDEEKTPKMMTLYALIIRGEKSAVKKLLTENEDLLETPDNFGRTPLMYCVLSDRLDCAKLLIKMKANLHHVDKAGRSALHLAAHKGSYKFVELLKERGGSIELQDNDGQTPLHLITRNRDTSCMEFLLRNLSPGMAEVTDNQIRTALHWSAAFNNKESVRLLIKYNCNAAVADIEGKTPLHWAANTHDQTVDATLKTLLESSPSTLNWQDYEGRTALHFAVAHENLAAVQALLNFEQEKCELDRLDNTFRTPLHWACQLGNSTIVKLLLSAGANNSISDENGATPLLYAALHNKSDVVSEMIRHDPNILEQADIDGRTALMWAAGKGANGVIQLLLGLNNQEKETQNGSVIEHSEQPPSTTCSSVMADINRVDNKGNTALHMASWNGHARSAELLLNCKAKHDLQNNMNHTPLFGACEKGHLPVVEILLDYNASINLRDLVERTPLHWAAIGGHGDVCDFLIQKGLDPDVRDAFHRSPLHCAAYGGHINCMNLLLENKANVDLQDQEGMSALHWAAQAGHLDATKLLYQCSAFLNLMEFTEERLTPLDHAMLNERDEVALYLMEQGALSSENIREIAATRIQACYRGYRVRKPFLTRKKHLLTHDSRLRSKKDRNRGKKKPMTSSTEQLNSVAEEPIRKSPVLYEPPASSADELAADVLPQQTADVTTINLHGETTTIENAALKNFSLADFFREDSIAPPVCSEQREDESPHPLYSSVLTPTIPIPKEELLPQEEEENRELVEQELEQQSETDVQASLELPNSPFFDSKQSEESTCVSIRVHTHTDAATVAGGDTTASEDKIRTEKRRKKKKQRQLPSLPASTSSDRLSGEEQHRKVKLKVRVELHKDGDKSVIKHSDSPPSSTSPYHVTESSSLTSETTSKSKSTPSANPPPLTTESSALLSFYDGDKSSPNRLSSSLNDLDNIGTDDQISVVRVSGLAYKSPNASRDFCQLEAFADSSLLETNLNSNLSLSEYIESLMSLSLTERKMLATIQRNRKLAFKQANSAAAVIQTAWRRYALKKMPVPQKVTLIPDKMEETVSENIKEDRKVKKKETNKAKKKKHEKSEENTEKRTHDSRRSSVVKEETRFEKVKAGTKREKSIVGSRRSSVASKEKEKSSPPKPVTLDLPTPKLVAKSSSFMSSSEATDHEMTKSSKKRRKRPQTCATVSSSLSALDAELKSRDAETKDTLHGQIYSDVDSDHFPRTRKVRPKTSHSKPRRHKNVKNFKQDELDKKIKELNKVYGQALLNDQTSPVLKSSIRHPVLPALRPSTSRTVYTSEFDRFHVFNPHNHDPVTAVQSYPVDDWKSLCEKKPSNSNMMIATPPVRKKSTKRKKTTVPVSKYTFQSLQLKSTYGASSSNSNRKTTSAAATRFSYNMRTFK